MNDQYPKNVTIRYPKVGTTNPVVKIYVASLETGEEVQVPNEIKAIPEKWTQDLDYVLYDIVWITDEEMAILYSNRVQNQAELLRCNKHAECNAEPEATYQEENGWLEPHLPKYNKDGTQKIEILAQAQGNDKFDHIVFTEIETNNVTRLTEGPFYVLSIYGWDEENNLMLVM